VISRAAALRAEDGRRVTTLTTDGAGAPVVLLVPPYGLAMRDLFIAAYLLYSNGFQVLRFDPRDHVGTSDGEMADFGLDRLIEDIELVARSETRVIVAAFSLAALPALQAALRLGSTVEGMVLITPVVNMRATLAAVIGADYWGRAPEQRPRTLRVLGLDVKTSFFETCKGLGYDDVQIGARLLIEVPGPVSLVIGDRDPWVSCEEVAALHQQVTRRKANVTMTVFEAASHQLTRNPVLALTYLHAMVQECIRISGGGRPLREVQFAELVSALHEEVIVGD
jgi:acyl transferase